MTTRAPTQDIDALQYQEQEAHGLRQAGWTVLPPREPLPSRCVGVDYEGCPVRTPRQRCRYCLNSRRIRRNEQRRARRLRVVA